jgi:hypothetical protein
MDRLELLLTDEVDHVLKLLDVLELLLVDEVENVLE